LQFHAGLELVDTKLLAVDGDFGARGDIGEVAKAAVWHLDEKVVPFDRYDFTILDLHYLRHLAGRCAGLGLDLRDSRDYERET
jgi:hypothetical protein